MGLVAVMIKWQRLASQGDTVRVKDYSLLFSLLSDNALGGRNVLT